MPATTADKRVTFRKLHESGCFVLPNPWDVGSAKALQHLGFEAIASTSAGFAWSVGKADNRVTLDEVCEHLTALCTAVDLPVNADFEGGFAHKPEKVAAIELAFSVRIVVKAAGAGQAWKHTERLPLGRRVILADDFRIFRSGADDRHLADKDVHKLGKLVYLQTTQERAESEDARVIGRCYRTGVWALLHAHGAELVHRKRTAIPADTAGTVKDRPRAGKPNADRCT